MNCKNCGKEVKDGIKFCPYCGKPFEAAPIVEPQEPVKEEKAVVIAPAKEEKAEEKKPKKKKKVWKIILLIVIILTVLSIAVVGVGLWFVYDYFGTLSPAEIFSYNSTYEEDYDISDDIDDIDEIDDLIDEDIKAETTIAETTAPETEAPEETEAVEEVPEPEMDPLEYFIVYSNETYFSLEDIEGFDADQCRIARNGVYARHGRKFKDQALTDYFSQYSWYTPTVESDNFSESVLNEIEKANLTLVIEFEEMQGYR